jgi:hypothetical protein
VQYGRSFTHGFGCESNIGKVGIRLGEQGILNAFAVAQHTVKGSSLLQLSINPILCTLEKQLNRLYKAIRDKDGQACGVAEFTNSFCTRVSIRGRTN